MLEVLDSHKAAAGDGVSFKAVVWNAVMDECNKVLTEGDRKTAAACKNKYGQMHIPFCPDLCFLMCILKLVWTFNIICDIKRVSGWHWSDETGASINAESALTWDDYTRKHKGAKPFCNHGWQYLAAMEKLQGSSEPKGKYIFCPSQGDIGVGDETLPDMEEWDDSLFASQHSTGDDGEETQESTLQITRPSTPVPTTHKCSTLSLGKVSIPEKRIRYTPSQQLGQRLIESVTTSMDSFGQSIKEALAPTGHALLEATPHRTQKAMTRVQDLEDWLNSWAADAYVMLEREDLRKVWVQGKLKSVPSDKSDPF
ncbi:uncharacterized protein ARMOST_03221 [Armillaria ostoyae]|uniref:Myb/SANT-like domain-containing protein n=1 Tax=Armillaria ostoyae TaxID=47428 RepID=A0A284QTV9_ARMOS|nr:uncharacterized protein ARMOST_03221 [Armillaria ostoyae]